MQRYVHCLSKIFQPSRWKWKRYLILCKASYADITITPGITSSGHLAWICAILKSWPTQKLARCSRVYWELPECCNNMILINVCTKFGQKFHWDNELFLLSTTRKVFLIQKRKFPQRSNWNTLQGDFVKNTVRSHIASYLTSKRALGRNNFGILL